MKKRMLLVFSLALIAPLASCGNSSSSSLSPVSGNELALVTDVGNIDDHSFNQATWEGVEDYSAESGVGCKYYKPSGDSTSERVASIDTAVSAGAKVIVMPGYLFNGAIKIVQDRYPSVMFLGVDCDPQDDDYNDYTFADNVTSIKYHEEQAGFFAGYAAVEDGYRKLGFIGGIAVPAVIKYGQGYVYGADYAAHELGLAAGAVSINYWYSGTFTANDSIATQATSWYTAGTEVIFSCGGGIYSSVVKAAGDVNDIKGNTDKKVIGVDVDQHLDSPLIITSAMKKLRITVTDYLDSLYKNNLAWPSDVAGKEIYKGVESDAVGLPTDTDSWGFKTFTVDEYNAIYAKVVDGTITVPDIESTDSTVTVSAATVVDYIS